MYFFELDFTGAWCASFGATHLFMEHFASAVKLEEVQEEECSFLTLAYDYPHKYLPNLPNKTLDQAKLHHTSDFHPE